MKQALLEKVLDEIKGIIGIAEFDDTKILIDMYGKLPDNITLKNIVILMTCAIKDGDKHFIHNYFRRSIASYIYI